MIGCGRLETNAGAVELNGREDAGDERQQGREQSHRVRPGQRGVNLRYLDTVDDATNQHERHYTTSLHYYQPLRDDAMQCRLG